LRLLLDTHYLVWLTIEQRQIASAERALLETASTEISCSTASLWELRLKWALKHSSGKRKGPVDPIQTLELIDAAGWNLIPVTAAHAVTLLDVPLDYSDPFDELLLVQAQVEGLRLLTRDARLQKHPLAYAV
jgi:PIN domain nuclease of toxin-antitoxin system